jgi:3-oxosteroid 1-dehydrogenase
MAATVGGALKIVHNNLAIMLGYVVPGPEPIFHPASNIELSSPHSLVVNAKGERFGDESSFQSMAPALRAYDASLRHYTNLPCWLVFDQQFLQRKGFWQAPRGSAPSWVTQAPSLLELSRAIGVDSVGLEATVREFNEFAVSGVDARFDRGTGMWSFAQPGGVGPNPSLGPLSEAPFFAVELYPSVISASGVASDVKGRVTDWYGRHVPGLYTIGNTAAHDEYGCGYQGGHSLASGMTFGMLAARDIAQGDFAAQML